MKSSAPDPGNPAPRQSLSRKLRSLLRPDRKKGHRLSANVTGEDDWEVDEPQIRMSRAFAVMLVLHLVAVGGLFAFHMFGKDDREAEAAATGKAHASSPPPPPAKAPAPAPASSAPVPPRAEVVADAPGEEAEGSRHVFKTGETKMLIAAKFGITVRELEEANPGVAFENGDHLSIPKPQRVIGSIAENTAPVNPPLALMVPSSTEDVGHREFALKKGDENPYAPVAAEDIEALSPEPPAPRARQVRAEPETTVIHEDEGEMEEPAPAPVARPAAKPKKPAPAPEPAPVKPKTKPATGSRTHVVQKGDTVYNVAKRYGLSPAEVMRANNIADPARMQMGQVLKITVKR